MAFQRVLNLSGLWEWGVNRDYKGYANVPGLVTDPKEAGVGSVWYRKEIVFPDGNWTYGTLILNGARFCPSVYVNGRKVSRQHGGMTVTTHLLQSEDVRPGNKILLEIELKSLEDVHPEDASKIPMADLWRTNISSCLWDNVIIKLHGTSKLKRMMPYPDIQNDSFGVKWEIERLEPESSFDCIRFEIMDPDKRILAGVETSSPEDSGTVQIPLNSRLLPWTPETPNCYKLRVILENHGVVMDQDEITIALKEFGTEGLKFMLNGEPVTLRAGTVVWHRWLRDPEARELAFDIKWLEKNIVERLKSHGANTLRFHLGMPPEEFLDLCDRKGLLVQAEWSFFHGMEASRESLLEQWRSWFDLCMRHPSIVLIHPWNETEGEGLETAFSALNQLSKEYPPLVVSHRDVIHIHKYWWSLFENVGVYYDSAEQFPLPIMVDEFGGNYMDGDWNPGSYPTVRESLARFLGPEYTRDQMIRLHTDSNSRIAEYWRRIGAAGFSPFCALGGPEDGSHHFVGKLAEGKPKPVWDALTAAYSPLSCSLDVWDRNFVPGSTVSLPLYLFNDTGKECSLDITVGVLPQIQGSRPVLQEAVRATVPSHSSKQLPVQLTLPDAEGDWEFKAVLNNPPDFVTHPVESSWRFRTMVPKVSRELEGIKVAIPHEEKELIDFLESQRLDICSPGDPRAGILVTSKSTWNRIGDRDIKDMLEKASDIGLPIVMLDIGPMELGQGYLSGGDLGPLQGVMRLDKPEMMEVDLFSGMKIMFTQMPEPESCIHPTAADKSLWEHLDKEATWLWNGLRGGLIVPAIDIEVIGLSPDAFLSLWKNRGADTEGIQTQKCYYAYELAGFYEFSNEDDSLVVEKLRKKVQFLVEDAPALKNSINPRGPVKIYSLSELYWKSSDGKAERLLPLALCGKNLNRVPAVEITLKGKGSKVIISQLITGGRLMPGYGTEGSYGLRYDPAAAQMVLNMLKSALS